MDEKGIQMLRSLAEAVIDEAGNNPEFGQRIMDIIGGGTWEAKIDKKTRKKLKIGRRSANRRDPAVLDPIELIAEGEDVLISELKGLTDKELKDIIADYAMDPSKLAMKWKDRDRIIGLIVEVSQRRASKGDAFRDQGE